VMHMLCRIFGSTIMVSLEGDVHVELLARAAQRPAELV
jgi:hypothetical protein